MIEGIMPELTIIGSSNAIPTRDRDNCYLSLKTHERFILIDCGSNALVRLMESGMHADQITEMIITHFHPDHVAGLPLLLMDLWLLGRQRPLFIYGLEDCLSRVEKMMDLFGWKNWPSFFQVGFSTIPEFTSTIIKDDFIAITSVPVKHLIPTIGLRVESQNKPFIIAYTCDTEPCEGVDELSRGANILIHESAGAAVGHSSAEQAGADAARAEVDQLVLIHYPDSQMDEQLINEASLHYGGLIHVAKDGMKFSW